eukprot:scaffold210523_cov32-Tisochrysis_lutea.AAC.2
MTTLGGKGSLQREHSLGLGLGVYSNSQSQQSAFIFHVDGVLPYCAPRNEMHVRRISSRSTTSPFLLSSSEK